MGPVKERRSIVCRPPRYPGRPEDYVFVKEYCRSKTRGPAKRPRGRAGKVPAAPQQLVTEQDLVMREAAQRLQEMPEFISFAQQHLRVALRMGQDLDRAYDAAMRLWDGQVDFTRDAAIRRCVTAIFRA